MAGVPLSAGMRAVETMLSRKEELARAITDAQYAADPALDARYGAAGRVKCLEDMRYMLEHLAPAVALDDPRMFGRYVEWLVELLRPRGIPRAHVHAAVAATAAVLRDRLAPDEGEAVARVVGAALGGADAS